LNDKKIIQASDFFRRKLMPDKAGTSSSHKIKSFMDKGGEITRTNNCTFYFPTLKTVNRETKYTNERSRVGVSGFI
jgi:hypothetical protein